MTPKDKKTTPKRGLGDFLCFAVYSANLAFGRAYKPILDQVGLTYPQYITIVARWEEDNQTVGSLGEKLFLESNTLTPLLKKLEAMGYVRRLREKISTTNLVNASGLNPEEFRRMRKGVADLRDNLIKAGSE